MVKQIGQYIIVMVGLNMKCFHNNIIILLLIIDLSVMYVLSNDIFISKNENNIDFNRMNINLSDSKINTYFYAKDDINYVTDENIIDNSYLILNKYKKTIRTADSINSNSNNLLKVHELYLHNSIENSYNVPQLTSSVSVNLLEELYRLSAEKDTNSLILNENISSTDIVNYDNTSINYNDCVSENFSDNIYFEEDENDESALFSVSSNNTQKEHVIEVIDGITYIDGIMIVNKTYSLPETYNPGGLLPEVTDAFAVMQSDAEKEGLKIYISSGYRSYKRQAYLHNKYIKRDGEEKADTYSARAGYSEHQTGLCIDLNSISDSFSTTPESKWVAEHAHEYGFIVRFPEGKEELTGYKYESWHLRYIGVEKATEVYLSGLCLEEFLGISSVYVD